VKLRRVITNIRPSFWVASISRHASVDCNGQPRSTCYSTTSMNSTGNENRLKEVRLRVSKSSRVASESGFCSSTEGMPCISMVLA
jgi:hypothetical protein